MSQSTATTPAVAHPPDAAPSAANDQPDSTPAYVDTPRLLNQWQLIGMAIAVVFGVLAATLQFMGWQADGRAADDTEQLTRVQEVQSSLLRADALATNAFLVGGLEPADQREEYDTAIDDVLGQITAAAEAQPADQEALAALSVEVNDYDAAVAQARTNNRQGFPVGAEYLAGASADLRTEALPILEALVEANTERADDAMGGQHPWWLLVVGVLALVGLWWLNRQLAQHFKRRINLGIGIAALIVLLTTIVTAVLAFAGSSANDDLREGSFQVAVDQAEARTAANDAKANESLRLIQRGSGEEFEGLWEEARATVDDTASRQADYVVDEDGDQRGFSHWETYVERHEQIKALDDEGDWDRAVRLATTGNEETGSTAPLDEFDRQSGELIDSSRDETIAELRSGRWFAATLAVLTLLLGAAAAVYVARGIGERRREYA